MIDPQKCVDDLLRNAPSENAIPLFDLMVWMEQQLDLKDNSEYLAAKATVYSNLDHCLDGQTAYAKERAERVELPSVNSAATH